MPAPNLKPKPKRRWVWYAAGIGGAGFLVILAILAWLYFAITQVPEFYVDILAHEMPEKTKPLALQAQQAVRDAREAMREQEAWELVFQEDDVNAWLEHELPKQYGQKWPRELKNPRVRFLPDEVLMAVTHEGTSVESVISLAVIPTFDVESHELSVELVSAKIGALEMPQHRLLPTLRSEIIIPKIRIDWEETEQGMIVARLQLPRRYPEFPEKEVQITTCVVREGAVVIEGTSRPLKKTNGN